MFLALAACGPGAKEPKLDAAPRIDGPQRDMTVVIDDLEPPDENVPPDMPEHDSNLPYTHTITIDGVDDFSVVDKFVTTTVGYTARVAWDANTLYLGYSGADVAATVADADQKWVFAYVDLDPGGTATGATTSVMYRTQTAQFPAGFGAELYARRKSTNETQDVSRYNGTAWAVEAGVGTFASSGDYMELAIPRSALNGATTIGIVTWMITEKDLFESAYAGIYAGNFTDGYDMAKPITKYLRVDFTSPLGPNDPMNERP